MKTKASLVSLLLVAGCGGGGGGDTPPPTAATPPAQQPPANTPPAASPPQAPVTAPSPTPPAPVPAPAPAPVQTPAPAPANPAPPPAAPTPAPAPQPAPAPVDNRPRISGASFARMMSLPTNVPFRGPPNVICAIGDSPECDTYGSIYGITLQSETYAYHTGPYKYGYARWSYEYRQLQVPISYQNGEVWFGAAMRIADSSGNTVAMLANPDGHTVKPGDALLLDVGYVAEWKSTDGQPYYARLQTGTYKGKIKNCWHLRLPGILRLACTLWDQPPASNPLDVRYAGELIIDDSNPGHTPVTFEGIH